MNIIFIFTVKVVMFLITITGIQILNDLFLETEITACARYIRFLRSVWIGEKNKSSLDKDFRTFLLRNQRNRNEVLRQICHFLIWRIFRIERMFSNVDSASPLILIFYYLDILPLKYCIAPGPRLYTDNSHLVLVFCL